MYGNSNKILHTLLNIAIIVVIGYIFSIKYVRFDLTDDKRYSISTSSKMLLDSVKDYMYIKVYLHGDLQYDYQKMSQSVNDLLKEYRAYNTNLNFTFIDTKNTYPTKKERQQFYQELTKKGLKYHAIKYEKNGDMVEEILFPGCVIQYQGRSIVLNFIDGQSFSRPDPAYINVAINDLEYKFGSALKKILTERKPRIGFLQGHGELSSGYVASIKNALKQFYEVEEIYLRGEYNKMLELRHYDALIVAKPTHPFSEKDKFIIDQFIMKKGKVLWFIDPVEINLDSLQNKGFSWGLDAKLNLQDMFFRYGFRINTNLVLDKYCAPLQVPDGQINGRTQYRVAPWYFSPLLFPKTNHPITSNIDPIITEFCSTIDIVGTSKHTKIIPLLHTSIFNIKRNIPVRIAVNIIDLKPDFKKQKEALMAVVLEGKFISAFRGRIPQNMLDSLPDFKYIDTSFQNKMLVVSDGNIIRNSFNEERNLYRELGYNPVTRTKTYGNKAFILNALDYLLEDNSLLYLRSRTVTLRKLDEFRVKKEKLFWQLVNIVLPIVFLICLGLVFNFYLLRKYTN